MKAEIELDVFSGRPNPAWEATPPEAEALMARIARLQPAKHVAREEGLGYRGFVVRIEGRVLRVYKGFVWEPDVDPKVVYRDTEEIEMLLASQAKLRGFGDLVGLR